ncbi:hypothetical protein LHYA1_G007004 [Lachnellula hyalina]|uniref:Uncharacterized protein n=1 Tax=Lachnellula hyalina TaxID=1316788 RepID=A0A8H8R0M9_9HELO|nr:uncharacterized protein LHYA1_G007004 [Lachnellula hyalina]TVY25245.1 hypothetical protein LHYA1_G007004 [Lachnellula hyalina]
MAEKYQVSKYGRPPAVPDAATQAAITKRDGGKCCITGKAGHFMDPLVVVPILPVPSRWFEDKTTMTRREADTCH